MTSEFLTWASGSMVVGHRGRERKSLKREFSFVAVEVTTWTRGIGF